MTQTTFKEGEYLACQNDPMYFIERYCIMVTPTSLHTLVLTDAQKEMVSVINSNKYTSVMAPRQFGKSIIGSAYILWHSLFKANTTSGIMSANYNSTKDIIDTIRELYVNVPMFLKPGLTFSNKNDLCFSNGSHILSAAPNANALRGHSLSLLFLDEFAFINGIKQDEFMQCVMPTLTASNGKCIIVSTPNRKDDLFWYTHHKDNKFTPVTYTWRDMPDLDDTWRKDQIANLGYKNFYQQFECRLDSINELYAIIEEFKGMPL